jgi:hypothetical protein
MAREIDWSPELHDPVLIRLRKGRKLSIEACAEEMRFSYSTVLRHATRLGLMPPRKPNLRSEPPPPKNEKPNPMAVAQFWLGTRLEERPAGYFLDRQPAGLDKIMREANRVAMASGAEPLLYKDSWRPC